MRFSELCRHVEARRSLKAVLKAQKSMVNQVIILQPVFDEIIQTHRLLNLLGTFGDPDDLDAKEPPQEVINYLKNQEVGSDTTRDKEILGLCGKSDPPSLYKILI